MNCCLDIFWLSESCIWYLKELFVFFFMALGILTIIQNDLPERGERVLINARYGRDEVSVP